MNRRNFLSALTGFAATAVLDPERLLWKPGKLISIPKVTPYNWFEIDTVVGVDRETGISIRMVRQFDLVTLKYSGLFYLPVQNEELLAKIMVD